MLLIKGSFLQAVTLQNRLSFLTINKKLLKIVSVQLTFTPSIQVQQTMKMGIAAWTVKFDPWIAIRQTNSLTVKFQIQVPAQCIITILSSRCSSPMRKQRGATKNNRVRGFLQTKELHASIITTK